MKIGLFARDQAPDAGGGFTFAEGIAATMLRRAGRDEVLLIGTERAAPAWMQGIDASYARMPVAPTQSRVRRTLESLGRELGVPARWSRSGRLRAFAKEQGVDLIVGLGPWAPIEDVPFFVTVWDLQHRLQPSFPEVSAHGEWESRERLYSRVLSRGLRVIVGTEAGKREVQLFYNLPEERIVVLPHPTPGFVLDAGERDPSATLGRFGLTSGEFVLYPAQFWAHKNHVTLVRALAEMRQRGWDLRAVMTGSDTGNLDHVLALARELGISDLVVAPGFVDRESLIDLYRSAFALTYMSLFGPENLPPLEAFALGCPVVAAHVSGSDEQLGDAAILVPGTDPHALADALYSLHDVEFRTKLCERGRTRALAWTEEDFVDELLRVARSVEPLIRTWVST